MGKLQRTKESLARSSEYGRGRRLSPSLAVSMLALFIALGGVGYAAATIGSAQIKNNSVQSKDIRNGTIISKDINRKTRSALRGQAGPPGAQGPRGAQGPAGLQGPRGVLTPQVASDDLENIPAGGAETTILSKAVPPGSYVVHAKANLFSINAPRTIGCTLNANDDDAALDQVLWDVPAANGKAPVSMLAVATVTTGPLSLRCAHSGLINTPGGSASHTKLVAIPVG